MHDEKIHDSDCVTNNAPSLPVAAAESKAITTPVVITLGTGADVGTNIPESDIRYVVDNMRDVERFEQEEFSCPHGEYELEVAKLSKAIIVAHYRGKPAFVAGVLEVAPGVVSVWGYGTNHSRKVMGAIKDVATTHVRDFLFNKHGYRRAQVVLPLCPLCLPNIFWLEAMGFTAEGVAHCMTASGGDAITLAYTIKDHEWYVRTKEAEDNHAGGACNKH